jgi:DNA-directed RNA polymerase specialized sigma24 family protein
MDDSGSRSKYHEYAQLYEDVNIRKRMMDFARRKLRGLKTPEDFVYDSYDALFDEFIVKDKDIRNFRGWLFTVLRNKITDFLRQVERNKRAVPGKHAGDLLDFTISLSADDTEELRVAHACDARRWRDEYSKEAYADALTAPLPMHPRQLVGYVLRRTIKEHRKYIVWSMLWDLSIDEIVSMSGESPKIVQARCNRARNHFRSRMKKFLGVI